jgi:hypothetical protein
LSNGIKIESSVKVSRFFTAARCTEKDANPNTSIKKLDANETFFAFSYSSVAISIKITFRTLSQLLLSRNWSNTGHF